MNNFVQRTLTYVDDKGRHVSCLDTELLAFDRPIVVLAEPGMGKSVLLEQLSKSSPETVLRSAASFALHPEPSLLVPHSFTALIDGLDELVAANDHDPVNKVLAQLIRAGKPNFILSCRAADWRGAAAIKDLSEEYGFAPVEMTLAPLSRESAIEILKLSVSAEQSEKIYDELDEKGMTDLLSNPLTVGLLGEIAANQGAALPKSRHELFKSACGIMWKEHDARHADSALAALGEAIVLDCAGAICAGLILAGKEGAYLGAPGETADTFVHYAEIASLPGAKEARVVLGSRLFTPAGGKANQLKPIHRSIAEYLGARWATRAITDDLSRQRFLASISIDGVIPSSVRGLHAWLPHFDGQFLARVVNADPFGLLRYGDADSLNITAGRQLLHSLIKLQDDSPYFRAEDWTSHSAKGLAHVELSEELRATIVAETTSFHLRTLLLEAIKGSEVASRLLDDLSSIVLNSRPHKFHYAERSDALDNIVAFSAPSVDWKQWLSLLNASGDEDSTRLSIELIRSVGLEHFSDAEIVSAIISNTGLGKSGAQARRQVTGVLYMLGRVMPLTRIPGVLDELCAATQDFDLNAEWETGYEITNFASELVARYVETEVDDPLRLSAWLRLCAAGRDYSHDSRKKIVEFLSSDASVRRAIFSHFIFHADEKHPTAWSRLWRAHKRMGVWPSDDDAIFFLSYLADTETRTEVDIDAWKTLAGFARRSPDRALEILAAAEPFVADSSDLREHLNALSKPPELAEWEIENEKRREREAKKREKSRRESQRNYNDNLPELATGALRWVHPIALAYLGLFNDIDKELSPPEKIGAWLGTELQEQALSGLDAVLSRTDLPSASAVAESYAESRRWNFIQPIIAGLCERARTRKGFDDLSPDLVIAGAIGLQHEHVENRVESTGISAAVEAYLRRNGLYETYVRLLIEPFLKVGTEHITGLYGIVRSAEDAELVSKLAEEWLAAFETLPLTVELELIHGLTLGGKAELLASVAKARRNNGYRNVDQENAWEAVRFQVAFEDAAFSSDVSADFMWSIRNIVFSPVGLAAWPPSANQLSWIVSKFRTSWPIVPSPREGWQGDTNKWDGARFLQEVIQRLGGDTSLAATDALSKLREQTDDTYSDDIKHAAYLQRRARLEATYQGLMPNELAAVFKATEPQSAADLQAIVEFALRALQAELGGNESDIVNTYYTDDGTPRIEDDCTDRLFDGIRAHLPVPGIARATQPDMPSGKRADLLFSFKNMAVPVECKGQWHGAVWSSQLTQLDDLYLKDWRSSGRGIYIVYWFGPKVPKKNKLTAPPAGIDIPSTPEAMRLALESTLVGAKKAGISIVVLDLTR